MDHGLAQLREARLTTFEIKTLGVIADGGGEVDWFPGRIKRVTNELVDMMVGKGYVEYVAPRTRTRIDTCMAENANVVVTKYGPTIKLRLTDVGRQIMSQLDSATVGPKVAIP